MTKVWLFFAWNALWYVAMLFPVWRYAHWSVAMVLTMCCFRFLLEDLFADVKKKLP
jgi:hypothetical protein